MKATGRRLRIVGMVLGSLIAGGVGAAQTSQDPTDGRALYHGFTAFAAGNDVTSYRMPSHFAACARCHGVIGEGGREGVVVAPALSWAALSGRRNELPAFANDDAVLNAVTQGAGRDGGMLAAAMPRYRLSAHEAAALISYLKRIGGPDDNPPGVTRTSVRLASVLPLSGPGASAGLIVKKGLEEIVAETNRSGGIHGRKIDVAFADANAAPGSPLAPAALIASAPFAIVGGMWRSANPSLDGILVQKRIGKIATLMPRQATSDLDAWDADLLPPLDVQQDALSKALQACRVEGDRLGVPIAMDSTSRDRGAPIQWFDNAAQMVVARDALPRGCYALGLAASAGLRNADDAAWEQHVVLPFPGAVLQRPDVWLTLGRAAARLTVELLSRSGARLHETSLLDAARQRGFEPVAGAPTRFTATRRYGWDADVLVRPATSAEPDHSANKGSHEGG